MDKFINFVVYGLIGPFFLWLIALVVLGIIADNGCVAAGYRDGKVTPNLTMYCIYRKDQTDTVLRYNKAVNNPLIEVLEDNE